VLERIGSVVQAVRERERCSLQDLAGRSGVPAGLIAALERGERGRAANRFAGSMRVVMTYRLDTDVVVAVTTRVVTRHKVVMTYLLDTNVVSYFLQAQREDGLPVYLRRLFDDGVLTDPHVLDDVGSIAVEPARRPTWWPSWRAGLGTATASEASRQ
jgi:transcriptional regulator with XRE-family HTH domain